jgi:hypothetical protein
LDAPLTFREFMTNEELPLAVVFREVLGFLVGRSDAVLFGAHAVNAYCSPERMTQDVDVLSTRGRELAEEVRAHLAGRLHIAVRVREVVAGEGFRVYQVKKPANRHLVDIRQTATLPPTRWFAGVRVIDPAGLVAMKMVSIVGRQGRPKAGTDLVDVQRLLLTFPELKTEQGLIADRLQALGAAEPVLARWRELATMALQPDEDEGY